MRKRKGTSTRSGPRSADDAVALYGDAVGPWIKTFAWWPCFTFDGGTVWLRRVWKRHIFKHQYLSGGGPDYWWQYRRFAPPAAMTQEQT